MRPPFSRRQNGMVLLEAIIALSIFSLVSFGLVAALDAALTAAKIRNEVDAAVRGLNNQRALLHSTRVDPIVKDVTDENSGLNFHIEIVPEQIQDQKKQPLPGMYRATITVKWQSGKETLDRSVSELIYQP